MIAAAPYIGLPWREPRPPTDPGLTCWGLVVAVYRDLLGVGLSSWSTTPPRDRRAATAAIAREKAAWVEVADGEERPFDLVLFRACHVGLVAERGTMLHVDERTPACLEKYRSGAWAPRILGFYRLA